MSTILDNLNCGAANTTECILNAVAKILEQIEEANQKLQNATVNLQPANDGADTKLTMENFAITTLIGFVALFFAVITILQALLASGPGRLKCNAFAIGPWAQLSNHRFDRSELRLRSTAYTPIINTDKLLQEFAFVKDMDLLTAVEFQNRPYKSNGMSHEDVEINSKSWNEFFPATWLSLLIVCGLGHPGWWPSTPQSPNYLPVELNAAPAYSTINDLFKILSLCADAPELIQLSYDGIEGLPSFRASSWRYSSPLDVDFRRHPFLGVYAVSQVPMTALMHRKYVSRPDKFKIHESTASTLLYAGGETSRRKPLQTVQSFTHRFDEMVNFIRNDFKVLHECSTNHNDRIPSAEWQDWREILGGYLVEVLMSQGWKTLDGGFLLLTASAIDDIRIFPWKKRQTHLYEGLVGLLFLSRFCLLRGRMRPSDQEWKHSKESLCGNYFLLDTDTRQFSISKLVNENFEISKIDSDQFQSLRGSIYKIDRIMDKYEGNNKGALISRILSLGFASALATSCIHEKGFEHQVSDKPLGLDLPNFLSEIQSSDSATPERVYHGEPISSVLSRLLRTELSNQAFVDDQEAVKAVSSINAEMAKMKKLWQFDKEKNEFKYPEGEVQHPLDNLLIYRAVLVAVYLKSVPDNSEYLDNPTYSKLIPVL